LPAEDKPQQTEHLSLATPLKPFQIPHFYRLLDHIRRWRLYLDTSRPGLGKSFCTSAVLSILNLKRIVIVCPKSIIGTWVSMEKLYNFKITEIITYESLRSRIHSQPRHGLLIRKEDPQ